MPLLNGASRIKLMPPKRASGRFYKTRSELNRNRHHAAQFLGNFACRVRHQWTKFQDALIGQARNRPGQRNCDEWLGPDLSLAKVMLQGSGESEPASPIANRPAIAHFMCAIAQTATRRAPTITRLDCFVKGTTTWRNATRAATTTTNPFRWSPKARPTLSTALNVRFIRSRPPASIAAFVLSVTAWRRAVGCSAVTTAQKRRA